MVIFFIRLSFLGTAFGESKPEMLGEPLRRAFLPCDYPDAPQPNPA
jgi:hypothetical protein